MNEMITKNEEKSVVERLLKLSARILLMHQRGQIRLPREEAHALATAVTETAFILGLDEGFWERVEHENKDLE